MIRLFCLICRSDQLETVIQLGMHPYADTFIDSDRLKDSEPVFPLECSLCVNCGHLQTRYQTDPSDRYSNYEYSYTSSNSSFSRNHWNHFFTEMVSNIKLMDKSLVVEIGSNDGYLGKNFIDKGLNFIGIDASPDTVKLAEKSGVKTIEGLFNKTMVKKIINKKGKADLIIANNVLNHSDEPIDFIESINMLLNEQGTFVFEVPYWPIDFKKRKFDKIYHEHVSYFSFSPLKQLLESQGLKIINLENIDYHGGSIRVYAMKLEKVSSKEAESLIELEKEETESGVFAEINYKEFMNEILLGRYKSLQNIYKLKEKGFSLIAIGAAARGNTSLNFFNLDSNVIDYVTDISPYKVGKFTPLTRIPIVPDEIFSDYKKVYAFTLTENINQGLKDSLLKINKDIAFFSI